MNTAASLKWLQSGHQNALPNFGITSKSTVNDSVVTLVPTPYVKWVKIRLSWSTDVEAHLRTTGVIDSGRNTKRAQQAASNAFNEWQQQSGRSLSEISQIVAYSGGDNRV